MEAPNRVDKSKPNTHLSSDRAERLKGREANDTVLDLLRQNKKQIFAALGATALFGDYFAIRIRPHRLLLRLHVALLVARGGVAEPVVEAVVRRAGRWCAPRRIRASVTANVFCTIWDCDGNPGPKPSYAVAPSPFGTAWGSCNPGHS